MMNAGERLREERERLGLSQAAAAQALEISKRTLLNWENGHFPPKIRYRDAMRRLGIDADFVFDSAVHSLVQEGQLVAPPTAGDGSLVMQEPAVYGKPALTAEVQPVVLQPMGGQRHERYVAVPRYDLKVSAGPGRGEPHSEADDAVGVFAFETSWMRQNLGRDGRGFASVRVRGDSMQPTLQEGDEIIIDRHIQRVDVSGIYVIALRGDLLVKRVQRKLDGSLVVKSDNAAYEPEQISGQDAEDFRVVGRMVWPRVR